LGNGSHHATTGGIFQENFTKKLHKRYSQMKSMESAGSTGQMPTYSQGLTTLAVVFLTALHQKCEPLTLFLKSNYFVRQTGVKPHLPSTIFAFQKIGWLGAEESVKSNGLRCII
jgi:hypothetical protein